MQGMKRRSFLDWLLRRPKYIEIKLHRPLRIPVNSVDFRRFQEACSDGDLAACGGRPDVKVPCLDLAAMREAGTW